MPAHGRLTLRLLMLLTAASLLVTLALSAIWVRSYWVGDGVRMLRIQYEPTRRRYHADAFVQTGAGTVRFGRSEAHVTRLDHAHPFEILRPRGTTQAVVPGSGTSWNYFRDAPGPNMAIGSSTAPPVLERVGVTWRRDESSATVAEQNFWAESRSAALAAPLWMLWLPSAALTLFCLARLRRRWLPLRRARRGQCPTCGYDLRGTPQRCPECGTGTVAGASSNAAPASNMPPGRACAASDHSRDATPSSPRPVLRERAG